jgi:hypothetical protein
MIHFSPLRPVPPPEDKCYWSLLFNWRGSNVDVGCLCIVFTRVMLLGSLDAESLFQRLDRCDTNCSLYFHVSI